MRHTNRKLQTVILGLPLCITDSLLCRCSNALTICGVNRKERNMLDSSRNILTDDILVFYMCINKTRVRKCLLKKLIICYRICLMFAQCV